MNNFNLRNGDGVMGEYKVRYKSAGWNDPFVCEFDCFEDAKKFFDDKIYNDYYDVELYIEKVLLKS